METIAFARGVPAPEMLPVDELREHAARVMERDVPAVLGYAGGAGWPPFVDIVAERCGVAPTRVVATTGSLQGFVLLCEVLVDEARAEGREPAVLVERPTYDRPRIILERLGVRVVAVDSGPEGMDVDAFREAARRERPLFAYVIPTFQNPSGGTMPDERRDALLEAALETGCPLLEDDPYGLLHFEQPAPASLLSRAEARADEHAPGTWFSGSCSKTIAPGLRAGWLVLDEDLAARVATRANDTYISPVLLGHAIAAEHLGSDAFEASVDRSRALLARRCAATCDALDEHLPEASWTAPGGGYFLWVRLPGDTDAREVLRAAPDHGVTLVAGTAFGEGLEGYVRLAFSSPPEDQLAEGIRRLAAATEAAMGAATRS